MSNGLIVWLFAFEPKKMIICRNLTITRRNKNDDAHNKGISMWKY